MGSKVLSAKPAVTVAASCRFRFLLDLTNVGFNRLRLFTKIKGLELARVLYLIAAAWLGFADLKIIRHKQELAKTQTKVKPMRMTPQLIVLALSSVMSISSFANPRSPLVLSVESSVVLACMEDSNSAEGREQNLESCLTSSGLSVDQKSQVRAELAEF